MSQVKFRGVEIDNKLNLEQHMNRICKSTANQLNAVLHVHQIKKALSFVRKKVQVISFVPSNFNYCFLVGMFVCSKSLLM